MWDGAKDDPPLRVVRARRKRPDESTSGTVFPSGRGLRGFPCTAASVGGGPEAHVRRSWSLLPAVDVNSKKDSRRRERNMPLLSFADVAYLTLIILRGGLVPACRQIRLASLSLSSRRPPARECVRRDREVSGGPTHERSRQGSRELDPATKTRSSLHRARREMRAAGRILHEVLAGQAGYDAVERGRSTRSRIAMRNAMPHPMDTHIVSCWQATCGHNTTNNSSKLRESRRVEHYGTVLQIHELLEHDLLVIPRSAAFALSSCVADTTKALSSPQLRRPTGKKKSFIKIQAMICVRDCSNTIPR